MVLVSAVAYFLGTALYSVGVVASLVGLVALVLGVIVLLREIKQEKKSQFTPSYASRRRPPPRQLSDAAAVLGAPGRDHCLSYGRELGTGMAELVIPRA